MVHIDGRGTGPIYLQVADSLETLARSLTPNVLFPTEEQLAQSYGVSRPTVRRALSIIEAKGLVRREQGRGTIVCPPKFIRHLVPARSIVADFREQGHRLDTRIVAVDWDCPVGEKLRRNLAGCGQRRVACATLVRSVAAEALVFERHFFSAELGRKIAFDQAASRSFSKLLAEQAGAPISHSDTVTEIEPCSVEVAQNLNIGVGTPVVIQRFQDHLDGGNLLQAGEMHYRTDRIRFSIVQNKPPYADGEAD